MLPDDTLAALFASDLARDVRAEYEERRCYGVSVADATAAAIAEFRHALAHATDGPVVILALAVLQLRDGALQVALRDAALELLDDVKTFAPSPGEPPHLRQDRDSLRLLLLDLFRSAPVSDVLIDPDSQ